MNEIGKFFDIVNKMKSNNKISHSYLIEVDNFENKFPMILDFVKLLICDEVNLISDVNCSKCNTCDLINKEQYPDVKIIRCDGFFIKKDQLINLKKEFNNMSMIGGKRVYIIEEADKLNVSSANTILKFLEEPNDDIIAILVTTNRYNVIDTILSRCQILMLKTNDIMLKYEDDLKLFLEYVNLDNGLFVNYNSIIVNIFEDKIKCREVLLELQIVIVNYLNYSYDKSNSSKEIYTYISKYKVIQLVNFVNILEEEISKLKYNVNFKIWLDRLFILIEEMKCNV